MNARKIGYGLTQAKQTTTQFCLCIMIHIKERGGKSLGGPGGGRGEEWRGMGSKTTYPQKIGNLGREELGWHRGCHEVANHSRPGGGGRRGACAMGMTPDPPPRQLHGLPDGEMWELKGEPDTRSSTPSSAIKTHFVGS